MKKLTLLFAFFSFATGLVAQKGNDTLPLDLSRPDDAVKAIRKLEASLTDGENVIFYFQGNVYSRIPGEKDKLLFRCMGMNIRATGTVIDSVKGYGYKKVSREILLYLDPVTGELLKTWKNPISGKEVEVMPIANDPVNSKKITFANDNPPYHFPGWMMDSTVFWNIEIPLFYDNPLGGEFQNYVGGQYHSMEMLNFAVPMAELLNPLKNRADDVIVSWCRICKWLPWMEMGDYTGLIVYNGIGKKIDSFDQLPDLLKNYILREHPEYTSAPPLNDTRPNETSWSAFKKWQGKKQAIKNESVKN